jgi:transcription elongation factor GreB
MSKAFTKEDGGGEDGLVPVRPRSTSSEQPRYITPEGYRALQEELAQLLSPPAPGEAGALDAAVLRRERERRAHEVADTLEVVKVVQPPEAPHGRVFFGAWVTLEDEDGQLQRWRLVGPDEADARAGRLSVESPLGRALLGREEGDVVEVERPRGRTEFTVAQVLYRTAADAQEEAGAGQGG